MLGFYFITDNFTGLGVYFLLQLPLSSLQHPFCRHQGLHSVVHEPVSTGPGPNPQRTLWTL